jgi:hypothetical protein
MEVYAVSTYEDNVREFFSKLPPLLEGPHAREILGNMSVAKFYQIAGDGKIKLRKADGKSLAETASLLEYMLSLPEAKIAPFLKREPSATARRRHITKRVQGAGR